MYWPLLCLYSQFCIFERCLDSSPGSGLITRVCFVCIFLLYIYDNLPFLCFLRATSLLMSPNLYYCETSGLEPMQRAAVASRRATPSP
jgi:hypothetical protein